MTTSNRFSALFKEPYDKDHVRKQHLVGVVFSIKAIHIYLIKKL